MFVLIALMVFAISGRGPAHPPFQDAKIGPFPLPAYMTNLKDLQAEIKAAATIPATGAAALIHKTRDTDDAIREGWKLINERKPASAAQAADIFEEAIRDVDSYNPKFYSGLGRAYVVGGQYDRGVHAFELGLALDGHDPQMHSGIGWAFWNLKEYGEAREAWEYAISFDRNSKDAWSAMAWIYLALKDRDRALLGFTTLLRLEPDNLTWLNGLTLARGSNFKPGDIRIFFPLPNVPDIAAAFAVPWREAAPVATSTAP